MALEDCPNVKKHTKSPDDYGGFFAWAEKMDKTHEVELCEGCQRYVIWRKRNERSYERTNKPHG